MTEAYSNLIKAPYTSLAQLQTGSIVSIWGVVVSVRPPAKTRGADYSMAIVLKDPTISNQGKGFGLVVFRPSQEYMPPITTVGQMIRCVNIRLQQFEGQVQGLSTHQFDCQVFSSPESIPILMKHKKSTSQRMIVGECERKILHLLYDWWTQSSECPIVPNYNNSANCLQLEKNTVSLTAPLRGSRGRPVLKAVDITPDIYFDIIAQVTRIVGFQRPGCFVVGLCDYTSNDLLYALPFQDGIAATVFSCTFWDERAEDASKLRIGDIVLLRNVRAKMSMSRIECVVHATKMKEPFMEVLDCSDPKCASLIQKISDFSNYNRQIMSLPMSPSISFVKHEAMPFSSVKDVLSCANRCSKFRLHVQVLDYLPHEIHNLTYPSADLSGFIYRFCLVLADKSGSLAAIVCHQDANDFLSREKPVNLETDSSAHLALSMLFRRLCPESKSNFDSRPYLDVCIMSYGEPRMYRIFDTILT